VKAYMILDETRALYTSDSVAKVKSWRRTGHGRMLAPMITTFY
jgi:hypothetical protein